MSVNSKKYKLKRIVSVRESAERPVTDIQVSHSDHLFVVRSPNGAISVSHNSALISISNLSDDRMRAAKTGRWWDENPNFSYANNSVAYTEKPEIGIFMKEWLSLYLSKSGERGIFNRDGAKKHIKSLGVRDHNYEFGLNPCVTGDTLVAVADGREFVSIRQLAEEERDISVYCLNDDGELAVSKMVNPRITGVDVPIYEVKIEGGHTCRVTANHKFFIRGKGYVEAKDLSSGDSLLIMSKTKCKNGKNDYWTLNCDGKEHYEHRFIFEQLKSQIPEGFIVHHKDHDSLNNSIANLDCVRVAEHNKIHTDVAGEKNPNYNSASNEEILKHIISLTKEKNRKLTKADWREYAISRGLPYVFSKFRNVNICEVFQIVANQLNLASIRSPKKLMEKLKFEKSQGYDCEIVDGKILYHKVCEVSGVLFDTFRKEEMVHSDYADEYFSRRVKEGLSKAFEEKKNRTRNRQAEIWNDLKFSLNREPKKSEWANACKEKDVSFEISRVSSPFRTYEDLKEYASDYNHKVISVTEVGTDTVYNGTVEQYHNYFIGGWEENSRKNKGKRLISLNNQNCGEVLLRDNGFCNLSTTIIRSDDTKETIKEKIRLATILGTLQSTLTNFRFLSKEWKRNAEEERLLGVSISGIMDNEFLSGRQDKEELKTFLREIREFISEVNKEFAEKIGINASVSWSVIKPEGNSSQLVGCSSGIHPRFSKYYIRRVQGDVTDPLVSMMKELGVPCEPLKTSPSTTVVFSFPMKSPDHAVFRNEVSAIEQLELYKIYKENYTTHNPSITIYVKEDEWMKVGAWVYENFDNIIGLTFLPYSDHIYTQAPYEEISEEKYLELVNNMPKEYNWDLLSSYEKEDNTTGAKELACSGGVCEI